MAALGTPIGFQTAANVPIREACAKARGAFWAQTGVLLQDSPLPLRYKMFVKTVQSAALWNAGCFPIQKQGLQLLNACQHKLLRRLKGHNRRPGEAWLTWEIRTLRETRGTMHRLGVRRWSTVTLERIWDLWGHIARHPSVARHILEWRSLSWWRGEQARPQGMRHHGRFCPHTDPERKIQEAVTAVERRETPWEELAKQRDRWLAARETFVKMFDVPWTSDRQVALEDGDHLQANREHPPPSGPRPQALCM